MRKLVVPAVVLGLIAIAVTAFTGSGETPYTLRMRTATADGLVRNQDVKIDGVRAGKITAVKLGADDRAEITMQMNPEAAPAGRDARTRIRSVSALGEKYVELLPGDTTRPAPSGAWVAADPTPPIALDQVLGTLDAGTRARLRIILAEGGTALTGRAASVRRLMVSLPEGMQELGEVLDQLTADTRSLKQVVRSGDRVIATLAQRRQALGRLVDEAGGALRATADRRTQLGAAVGEAPATLAQLRGSLRLLTAASTSLQPASDRLRQSAAPVHATLKALPRFTEDAVPTLKAARAAAPDLARLARGLQPAITNLGPVARKLRSVLEHADPLVQGLDKGLADDALYFLQTWARVTARSDGLGHVFGAQITVTEDTVRMITDRVLAGSNANDPPARRAKPAAKGRRPVPPASATPSVKPPQLPEAKRSLCTTLDDATKAVTDVLGKVAGQSQQPPPQSVCDRRGTSGAPSVGGALKGLLGSSAKQADPRPAPAVIPPSGDSDVQALVDYLFGS